MNDYLLIISSINSGIDTQQIKKFQLEYKMTKKRIQIILRTFLQNLIAMKWSIPILKLQFKNKTVTSNKRKQSRLKKRPTIIHESFILDNLDLSIAVLKYLIRPLHLRLFELQIITLRNTLYCKYSLL